jgi:hypothetical protein
MLADIGPEGRKLVLAGVVPGTPPSSNRLYSRGSGGKRFLTKEGRAFKIRTIDMLRKQWMLSEPLSDKKPYWLVLRFYLSAVLTKTYGQKGGADSPFKRIDTSGFVKIIEDAIAETTGVDDRNNMRLTLMKYQEPGDVRCEIEFWELENSDFLR